MYNERFTKEEIKKAVEIMELEKRINYKEYSYSLIAEKLHNYFTSIIESSISDKSVIKFKSTIDNIEYDIVFKEKYTGYDSNNYHLDIREKNKDNEEDIESIVSDILEIRGKIKTSISSVSIEYPYLTYIKTKCDRYHTFNYRELRIIESMHKMQIGCLERYKIEAFFLAFPLSLVKKKKIIKILFKLTVDRRENQRVKAWQQIASIFKLKFSFHKFQKTTYNQFLEHSHKDIEITPYIKKLNGIFIEEDSE